MELIQVNKRETANVRCSRRCRNEASFSSFVFDFFLFLSSFERMVGVGVAPMFGETRWFLDEER